MPRLIAAVLSTLPGVGLALAQVPLTPFMPETVSGPKNEYNLSLSDDGRTMVFARSEADFGRARIMVSERWGSSWSVPVPIAFSDARYRDSDPWVTPDGRTLYFASDRPTPSRAARHDLDIWRSHRSWDGSWAPPEHLGDEVNGAGEELGPELHDGMLYFATARRSGMGGLDIYTAKVTAGGFMKPELLPPPINSAASESDFTLSRDRKTALFWRQVGGRGLLHVARRNKDGAWSDPEPLPDSINVGPFNFTPALSANGGRLTFASTRLRSGQAAAMADIFEVEFPNPLRSSANSR